MIKVTLISIEQFPGTRTCIGVPVYMECTYGGVSAVCCAVTDCEIANRAVGLLRKPPGPPAHASLVYTYCVVLQKNL